MRLDFHLLAGVELVDERKIRVRGGVRFHDGYRADFQLVQHQGTEQRVKVVGEFCTNSVAP